MPFMRYRIAANRSSVNHLEKKTQPQKKPEGTYICFLSIENQMRPYTDGPDGAERVTRFSVQMLYEGLGRK